MFQHLIVPLDGSRLAESVLPTAAEMAQTLDAKVTLLHVIEHNAPEEVHGERHLTNEHEALVYLHGVAEHAFPENIQVEMHVHSNEQKDVARSIVEHATEFGTDLIAMCTHGRGGLRTWLFGSIAQQVVSLGKKPVLLVQPGKTVRVTKFNCGRLLVPVDGDPDHEEALQVATGLAQVCQAQLHLLMVVHTYRTLPAEKAATATLLPGATSEMLDMTEEGAHMYLQRLHEEISETSIQVTSEVQRGDPAKLIATVAKKIGADLIVIGTHGKTGMDAFWSGSMAPKISKYSLAPLLLVPVHRGLIP
jgi:nucleotide-binding universal stress UspA family protein